MPATVWRRRARALLSVDHPQPEVRTRATNALVVLAGVFLVGLVSTVPLFFTPGGAVAGVTCGLVTLVALGSGALIRSGHVDIGLAVFFLALMVGNLAAFLVGNDARLTSVYLVIPVAIAGVTLPFFGTAIVTTAAVAMSIWGTLSYPSTDPAVSAPEIITAGLIVMLAVLVTSLLGGWGQRREAVRADKSARRASELAEGLRITNTELEDRVVQRTEELQYALARQETLVGELAELSVRDSLTGLHNRRHADDELPRLVAAGERYGQSLSLAIADLDHFKEVNDRYSYTVGDQVLQAFARILAETARSSDLVARYGGEEFLLVMPQTGLEHGTLVCQRLRESVAAHPWNDIAPGLRVTVSVGVADSGQSTGLLTLVSAADMALHEAKRSGRDRVVAWPSGERRTPLTPTD